MKISRTTNHGKGRWRVHYFDASTDNQRPYAYRFFKTKSDAEAFVATTENERRQYGERWMALSQSERENLIEAYLLAERAGLNVLECVRRMDPGTTKTRTLEQLVAEVIDAKRARGLRERSVVALKGTLERFAGKYGSTRVDMIAPAMVRSYVDSMPVGQIRKRGILTDISTMFAHAVRMEYVPRNPCDSIERPIVEAKPISVLTVPEAERLFRTVESEFPKLVGFVALAAFGGFRTESEIGRMKHADIVAALAAGVLRPPVENKTRRQRLVPLLPCLRAWLELWIPLGLDPIYDGHKHEWQLARKAAGIWPWPQNVLRHSRVSYRLAATGDEVMTAAEDGHSAAVLHANYKALVTKDQAEAYFGIFPKLNSPLQQ